MQEPYVRQKGYRRDDGTFSMVVDFWLTRREVVLEVNGTYWHADPRVYPVPKEGLQARCVARYERKKKALLEMGVQVLEVWESDIKTDPTDAVRRVLG